MLRAQEGLQGYLLHDGGMDNATGMAMRVLAEVYLGGGQEILTGAYLEGE